MINWTHLASALGVALAVYDRWDVFRAAHIFADVLTEHGVEVPREEFRWAAWGAANRFDHERYAARYVAQEIARTFADDELPVLVLDADTRGAHMAEAIVEFFGLDPEEYGEELHWVAEDLVEWCSEALPSGLELRWDESGLVLVRSDSDE